MKKKNQYSNLADWAFSAGLVIGGASFQPYFLIAKNRTILKIAQMLSNVGVNISDYKRQVLRFLIKVMTVSRWVILH